LGITNTPSRAANPGRKEQDMTKAQEWRMAKKCMGKALKHLHLSNKFGWNTEAGDREWNLYRYFRGIYDAHENALNDSYTA
jgi:hypothetical protein